MDDLEIGDPTHLRVPGSNPGSVRNSLGSRGFSASDSRTSYLSMPGSETASPYRPNSSSSDANDRLSLDADNIGPWVVGHHFKNLILKVEEPRTSSILSRILSWYRQGDPPHGDPSATSSPSDLKKQLGRLPRPTFRISFAELQRMKMRKLQCELVKDALHMRCYRVESPGWDARLEQYIQTVRDYEYMTSQSSQKLRDPFLATGEYAADHYIVRKMASAATPGLLDDKFETVPALPVREKPRDEYAPNCGTRGENERRAWVTNFQKRVGMAAVGGTFLVAPMWLMVLVKAPWTSLVSTTAFVAVFGVVMAWFLTERKDVLASTAAYAAVLVVFVGANSPVD